MKRRLGHLFIGAAAVVLMLPAAQAQMKGRGMPGRMYDANTETTFKGTVANVTQGGSGMMMMGTHLTIETPDGSREVMLGPTNFISGKGFTFAKGDEVEITASKVNMGGTDYLIAREVVKGGKTLTLRDKAGMPEWSGMRRGYNKP